MSASNGTVGSVSITPHALGQAIRAERMESGYSQRELGELLGIDRSGVSRLESGKKLPSLATLNRLSEVLLIPVEELILMARMFERVL